MVRDSCIAFESFFCESDFLPDDPMPDRLFLFALKLCGIFHCGFGVRLSEKQISDGWCVAVGKGGYEYAYFQEPAPPHPPADIHPG